MSVILTACRHSRQKAIEKALKKKAEKKREKRMAAMSEMAEKMGMENLEGENNVKIWTFLLNGAATSVVLHRDTLEVACNGEVVESTGDFCHCGATIDFKVGSHKARIISSPGARPRDGMVYTLTIEGCPVPDSSPPSSDGAMGPSSDYSTAPFPGGMDRSLTDLEGALYG